MLMVRIKAPVGHCESKDANDFFLRDPYLATFVIRTLGEVKALRHEGTEQTKGPRGQGARIGRPVWRRSFGCQRACDPAARPTRVRGIIGMLVSKIKGIFSFQGGGEGTGKAGRWTDGGRA